MTNEQLVDQIKNGYSVTASMEKLYNQNLPLIHGYVKPFASVEPLEDLMQEAYFGLYEAVKHYDNSVNVKFMTYAKYWIIQAAQSYIVRNCSKIRISNDLRGKIRRYREYVEKYIKEHGKEPDLVQIQTHLGFDNETMDSIRSCMQSVQSMDAAIGTNSDGEEYTLSDLLYDETDVENDIVEQEYKNKMCNDIWYAVDHYLFDREQVIIYLYYKEDMTLETIGKEFGISTTRAGAIKQKALERLRTGKAGRLLEQYATVDKHLYHTSLGSFENYGSSVENMAIRKMELEEFIRLELDKRKV